MNKYLSIGLILLVLLQSISKTIVYIDFKIHQKEIAERLCVNRNNLYLHCNGNCVLMQRMKAHEGSEQSQLPHKSKEVKEIVLFFEPAESPDTQQLMDDRVLNCCYAASFATGIARDIEYPPQP